MERTAAAAEAVLAVVKSPAWSTACWAAQLQEHGWHVEVVPSKHFYCGTSGRCIIITTAAVAACWRSSGGDGCSRGGREQLDGTAGETQSGAAEATLLFLLAHELGHGLAQHTVGLGADGGAFAGCQL